MIINYLFFNCIVGIYLKSNNYDAYNDLLRDRLPRAILMLTRTWFLFCMCVCFMRHMVIILKSTALFYRIIFSLIFSQIIAAIFFCYTLLNNI